MKEQQEYRAGIYTRISADDGVTDRESNSITTQKQILTRYANEHGFRVVEYYADDGYSGTNFNRPEFKRMMGDIEMGKINLVLTKDLSRLGRNHILTGQYTDIIFPQYDVRYIAVGDGVDTLYDDNDIAPFKNVLNEMYARDISKKQRASMANRRANGLFTGNLPPYGYLIDPEKKHHFIVDEAAAKVVRHIFDLALQGYGGRAIGTMLQHEKVLRPSYHYAEIGLKCGTLPAEKYIWHEQTIRKMLHDPTYTGAMVGNKRPTVSFQLKKRVKSTPDELVIIEDMHEPIISKEDFETVQRMLEKRHKDVDLVPKGVLNGVLKCAECGKTMSRNSKKNGKDREFYCCRTYRNHGKAYCTHHFLSSIDAQKMVLASIREKARLALKDDGKLLQELCTMAVDELTSDRKTLMKQVEKAKARLAEIDIIISNIYEDKALGRIPEHRYLAMTEKYDAESKKLQSEIEEIENHFSAVDKQQINTEMFIEIIRKYRDIRKLTPQIVSDLIDKIVVGERQNIDGVWVQQFDIYYRFVGLI